MLAHRLARSAFAILLLALQVASARAQAGPPCGPDLPIKCTPGKDAGILLAFVGAGILAAYLGYRMDHPRHQALIVGCTAQADGTMTLVEDNTQILYSLAPVPKKVRAGQRVTLRGRKKSDPSGKNLFQARKLVKDEGPCESQSPGAAQENAP
jgi:hypothetical protein